MRRFALGLIAALAALAPLGAEAQSAASDWMVGNSSRIRLVAGPVQPGGRIIAAVQIELADGWKTYWRNPGEAGGVPPELDWKASGNVAKTDVMYPAPHRLTDANGENIGYKHGVIFPVAVQAADPAKPVTLDLKILFGVCKNICIPEDRHLTLTLDPGAATDPDISALLTGALAAVPADPAKDAKLPQVKSVKIEGGAIVIETQFPAGADGADLFAEPTDTNYVPMAQKLADSGDGIVRFRIDLSKTDDFKTPKGKSLKLTLVSTAGASEVVRALP
jgi:DsbC/DsbD-like thiol-disulfide interchange protein